MNRCLSLLAVACLMLSTQLARAGLIHGETGWGYGSGSLVVDASSASSEVPAATATDDLARISNTAGAAGQVSVDVARAGLNEASAAFGLGSKPAAVAVPEPSTAWMFAVAVVGGFAVAFRRRLVG